jgi:hypothetical protein
MCGLDQGEGTERNLTPTLIPCGVEYASHATF